MGKHLLLPNRSAGAGWAKWAVNGYNLCRMARGELLICRRADLWTATLIGFLIFQAIWQYQTGSVSFVWLIGTTVTGRVPAFSTLFRRGWTAERKDKKRVQKEGSKSRQGGSLDGLAWKYALMVRRRVWYCIGQRLGQSCWWDTTLRDGVGKCRLLKGCHCWLATAQRTNTDFSTRMCRQYSNGTLKVVNFN